LAAKRKTRAGGRPRERNGLCRKFDRLFGVRREWDIGERDSKCAHRHSDFIGCAKLGMKKWQTTNNDRPPHLSV
jgi:hypothetical protein